MRKSGERFRLEQAKPDKDQMQCLNCDRELQESDAFCSHCGQKVVRPKLTLASLVCDFFVVQFSLEGRFFQSLKTLLLSPGKLTVDYWDGKRARYFSPIQVYLATSVIFFLLLDTLSSVAKNPPIQISGPDVTEQIQKSEEDKFELTFGFRTVTLTREQFVEFLETDSDGVEDFFLRHDFELNGMTLFFSRIAHIVMQPGGLNRFFSKYFRIFSQSVIILMPVFGFILYGLYWRKAESSVLCIVFSAHFHAFAFLVLIGLSAILSQTSNRIAPPVLSLAIMTYFVWAQKTVFGGSYPAIILKSFVALLVYCICVLLLVVLLIPVVYLTL